MSKVYEEYFNYYLVLERDFFAIEPYLTIDKENFKAFSIQNHKMLLFKMRTQEFNCSCFII